MIGRFVSGRIVITLYDSVRRANPQVSPTYIGDRWPAIVQEVTSLGFSNLVRVITIVSERIRVNEPSLWGSTTIS